LCNHLNLSLLWSRYKLNMTVW